MSQILSQKIALYKANRRYTQYFCHFGAEAEGVHWKNKLTQHYRFKMLCEVLDNQFEDISINDFGCGYGGLWTYLLQQNFRGRYNGYDMNASMIAFAKKHFSHQEAHFFHSQSILYPADFTLISGTFNLKMNAARHTWWNYIQQKIKEAWKASIKGLAFNLLLNTELQKIKNLYYCDQQNLLEYCHQLSPDVGWKIEPSLNDITIYLRRKL